MGQVSLKFLKIRLKIIQMECFRVKKAAKVQCVMLGSNEVLEITDFFSLIYLCHSAL